MQLREKVESLETTQVAYVNRIRNLEQEIGVLKSNTNQYKGIQDTLKEANKLQISVEQAKINSNLVIKGAKIAPESDEGFLRNCFEKIRNKLGVSGQTEFDPVDISTEHNQSSSQIIVKLSSAKAKKKLLQIKRTKNPIHPLDLEVAQENNRSILIVEHLTKENQNLLYKARSLRESAGYKYVWSSNGQILIRKRNRPKVQRVINFNQIEDLVRLSQHGLEYREYTRHDTNSTS